MTGILQNYLPLVVFIGVASLIGLALLIAPFLVAFQQPDSEKLSAYECGFNAFDDARMKFDVRFYLVAILFIIFDLEVGNKKGPCEARCVDQSRTTINRYVPRSFENGVGPKGQ